MSSQFKLNEELYLAAKSGDVVRVTNALRRGADPNFHHPQYTKRTPLHVAANFGRSKVIPALIEAGADPNSTNEYTRTPLHLAAIQGHADFGEILIKLGAYVDAVTKENNTPLHLAAHDGHTKTAIMLIRYGASCHAINKDSLTPLDLAKCNNHHHLVEKIKTDEKLHQVFKHGIHNAIVRLTNMRLVLLGPPCVGKTSFKSLLFNWPAPKFHHSTALATRPIRAIERVAEHDEGKIWEKVNGVDLLKMLSDAVRALEEEPTIEDSGSCAPPTSDDTMNNQKHNKQNNALEQINFSTDEMTTDNYFSSESAGTYVVPITSTARDTSFSKLNTSVHHYSKEMMEILEERSTSEGLHETTWINILDSGGQPQFADVSRAFIRGNTLNIICTKLTESLSDKPKFSYSLNGKLLNLPSELQMTNLQLIEHFVCSIVASKNAGVVGGNKRLPLIMIVGTYYDKVKGLTFKSFESLHLKNEQLLSTLHEFQDHFIFYNNNPQQLIFPVDNLCWLGRKKMSSFIRECIMSCQKDIGITVPIPVRWYMFEMCLKEEASQQDHGMVSLDSCCSIGVNFNMNRDDVLESITHLNSMALFLYFPLVLPNIIFTNPQYLLDMLSALISVSFVNLLGDILQESQSLLPDSLKMFRNKGVFDDLFLDKLCFPFVSELFTKTELLKLLQHLCIIAPLSTSNSFKRFFMPVVLPPNQVTENIVAGFTTTCDPMIIAFESKVIPQGIFPATIVALVNRKEEPCFFIDSRSPTFPCQLRFAVLLYSEDLFGSVLLVDQFYWIEVYYNGLTENCFQLRKVICKAIATCTEILAYDEGAINAKVTVPCLQEHQLSGHKLHPVILSMDKNPPAVRCSIESHLPTLLLTNERQTCWLIETQPVSLPSKTAMQFERGSITVPISTTIPHGPLNESHLVPLIKVAREIEDWEMLGIFLGIKNVVLKDIKNDNQYQSGPARKDMLMKWLQGGKATKADFIEALKNMGQLRLVHKIESLEDVTDATSQVGIEKSSHNPKDSENKPDKLDLIRLLTPIAYKWQELGEALKLEYGALMSLQQNFNSDEKRLSEVLQLWIDQQPTNVNWSTIIMAVQAPPVGNLSVAESIRSFRSKIEE